MENATETITYYLMVRFGSEEPMCIFARVAMPSGRFFDFLCNAKREWSPDTYNDLARQLWVMPDFGFRGEVSAEEVLRLNFPLFDPEAIVEDPI